MPEFMEKDFKSDPQRAQFLRCAAFLLSVTAHLDIITWTLERSGRIVEEVLPTKGTASPSFYFLDDARRAPQRR